MKRCTKCGKTIVIKRFVDLEKLYGCVFTLGSRCFTDIYFKDEYSDWCKKCLDSCEDPSEYYKAKYYEEGK